MITSPLRSNASLGAKAGPASPGMCPQEPKVNLESSSTSVDLCRTLFWLENME